MTSPGGNSPETNLKPRLRKDEILAELERNDNPQSPPMIVFKLLRSEKLKQKRYVRTTNFICDKPATKLSSGNDLPESIMIQQKEELTRNDNPQSPPIKRFCQLRTEKILKAAKRQPGFDLGKTVTKDKVTRSKTKLNLFGMTSDSLFSDIVEERSPKIISQKDSIDNTKESTAKEEDANLSFARLTHTNQNTTSSYRSPRKIVKLAKQNENTVTESKHDKAEVIPIGNKVSLESDNNNIVEKIEESDGEENSVINKSKSSNVSILKGLSCQQHQPVHGVSTSQKYLLSDEQTDSQKLVNVESNSAKTFIECSEDKQDSKAREPIQCLTVKSEKSYLRCTVNLANLTELETGCSKQVDNPDGSELKKVVRENSRKFQKVSKNKVTEVQQEDVGHGKDETEKQTKEAGESKPEAGEQIAMASSSLNRLEQNQTTQLGSLHQLETSLTETGEAEITSPGSTQVNQYPNMPADTTRKQGELADITAKKDLNVSLKSKSVPNSLPVFSECFIPLSRLEKVTKLPLNIVTKRKEESPFDCKMLQQVVPLENEAQAVQVNAASSETPVMKLKQFAIKLKPLNYVDLNRLSNKSKHQLFANDPLIRLTKITDNRKKSVKRNLSFELLLGDDKDALTQLSKKPRLIENELRLK